MFDKVSYWKRRKAGQRGQGDKWVYPRRGVRVLSTVVGIHDTPDWPRKEPTKKALLKNTKRARKAKNPNSPTSQKEKP